MFLLIYIYIISEFLITDKCVECKVRCDSSRNFKRAIYFFAHVRIRHTRCDKRREEMSHKKFCIKMLVI